MFLSEYATLDCLVDTPLPSTSEITQEIYTNMTKTYLESAIYPWKAAVTYYDTTTKTITAQGCIDASTLAGSLSSLIAGGSIPDWAMSLISIATWLLQFTHYQMTAILSTQRALDAATLLGVTDALTLSPGGVTLEMLTGLNVSAANCPNLA